jgi:SET domain-containing protein
MKKLFIMALFSIVLLSSLGIYTQQEVTPAEKRFINQEFNCESIVLDSQNFGLSYDEDLVSENEILFSGYTKFLVEGCLDRSTD